MIKIAIVDDSIDYIRFIYDKVDKIMKDLNYDQYEIKTFTDGIKLVESNIKFDLLLLDIDMPTINGFNLAEKVSNNLLSQENTTIIYITTYENLVYEAFKYSPLRFIRKNRINEELLEAIQAFLNKKQFNSYSLMFSTDLGKRSLPVNEIVYIEVHSHKLYVHEKGKLTIANGNLKDVEEQLRTYGFIKTHQSFLVNYKYINFINHSEVLLDNKISIPLSRGRYEQVKKEYMVLTREQ
jgi:DNA-binding LytR/AlgR family response regulator